MNRWSVALSAFLAFTAACSDEPPIQELEAELKPGVVPIGGEGRPQTLHEATQGESDVALWQVSDEDTIVYLLGTVHLLKPGTDWKNDAIRKAFNQSRAAYLEADVFSKAAQRSMGLIVTKTAEYSSSQMLTDFYDQDEQAKIDEGLALIGSSLDDMKTYRPWFATLQASLLSVVNAGGDPSAGADVMIAREMLARRRPLRYLETAAQQMQMMAAGDDETDAAYFLEMVDALKLGEAYFADLIGAWYQGDVERLDFLVNSSLKDYPELHRRLLLDRNQDWALQLDRLLTDERGVYLVAVGVGHLVGKNAVQAQLVRRGYEPIRVN
ncbi:MAG: TraB/GumN family protein [Pseudomonadota bacterium]